MGKLFPQPPSYEVGYLCWALWGSPPFTCPARPSSISKEKAASTRSSGCFEEEQGFSLLTMRTPEKARLNLVRNGEPRFGTSRFD